MFHKTDLPGLVSNDWDRTLIEILVREQNVGKLWLSRTWESGDISSVCCSLPGLPERLLNSAAHKPEMADYIFSQLANDEDKYRELLQEFSASCFTAEYMRRLFNS